MRRNRQGVSDTFLVAEANAKQKIMDQAQYFQDQLEQHNNKGQKAKGVQDTKVKPLKKRMVSNKQLSKSKSAGMLFGDNSSDSGSGSSQSDDDSDGPKGNGPSFKAMQTL